MHRRPASAPPGSTRIAFRARGAWRGRREARPGVGVRGAAEVPRLVVAREPHEELRFPHLVRTRHRAVHDAPGLAGGLRVDEPAVGLLADKSDGVRLARHARSACGARFDREASDGGATEASGVGRGDEPVPGGPQRRWARHRLASRATGARRVQNAQRPPARCSRRRSPAATCRCTARAPAFALRPQSRSHAVIIRWSPGARPAVGAARVRMTGVRFAAAGPVRSRRIRGTCAAAVKGASSSRRTGLRGDGGYGSRPRSGRGARSSTLPEPAARC